MPWPCALTSALLQRELSTAAELLTAAILRWQLCGDEWMGVDEACHWFQEWYFLPNCLVVLDAQFYQSLNFQHQNKMPFGCMPFIKQACWRILLILGLSEVNHKLEFEHWTIVEHLFSVAPSDEKSSSRSPKFQSLKDLARRNHFKPLITLEILVTLHVMW